MQELERAVRMRGGAAHSAQLRQSGFSPHLMGRAVSERRVERMRRSWLVDADCDPDRRRAIALGGRITCVSAAAGMGLWVPESDALHIAVAPTSSRQDAAGAKLHWAVGPQPVERHALIDARLNVLFHVARCLAPPDALAVWESAIRAHGADPAELRRVRWRCGAATEFARVASSLSDSGIETRFVLLMRSLGVALRQQVWIDGHPVDAVIGERLLVQIDGFAHHQGRERRRDLRADARLILRGYTVLRFDYFQVLFSADEVIATVANAVAQELHVGPRR